MMNLFDFSTKLLKKRQSKQINKSLPDPNSVLILEAHLNKLREAQIIVNDIFNNRSEGYQLHHNREICEVSIAEAALSLSEACGELGLKLHTCKSTEL